MEKPNQHELRKLELRYMEEQKNIKNLLTQHLYGYYAMMENHQARPTWVGVHNLMLLFLGVVIEVFIGQL